MQPSGSKKLEKRRTAVPGADSCQQGPPLWVTWVHSPHLGCQGLGHRGGPCCHMPCTWLHVEQCWAHLRTHTYLLRCCCPAWQSGIQAAQLKAGCQHHSTGLQPRQCCPWSQHRMRPAGLHRPSPAPWLTCCRRHGRWAGALLLQSRQ